MERALNRSCGLRDRSIDYWGPTGKELGNKNPDFTPFLLLSAPSRACQGSWGMQSIQASLQGTEQG